jgi:hypothetical protein
VSLDIEVIAPPRPAVRSEDRLWDLCAATLVGGGVVLFAVGRQALSAMAEGRYIVEKGGSWIARADLHAAQTRWGVWLIGAGVLVALISAVRHALHRRQAR